MQDWILLKGSLEKRIIWQLAIFACMHSVVHDFSWSARLIPFLYDMLWTEWYLNIGFNLRLWQKGGVGASRRGASPILAWMCSKGGLISAIFSILSRLNPKSGVSVTIWTFVNAVVIHRALGLLIIGGGRGDSGGKRTTLRPEEMDEWRRKSRLYAA